MSNRERIGTVLDRRYRLDDVLGAGSTGTVYRAWHLNLEREVAIKMLHPQFLQAPDQIERFRLEAQVMGLVGHENLVQVSDFRYTPEGLPYMVMELVQGETLRERLARGPLPLGQVAVLFPPLCEALGQAHTYGILHGDLKPENLILQRGERGEILKILDFGAARLSAPGADTGEAQAGTLHYLAPERLRPGARVDRRADLFSIGTIVYECVTGEPAFRGATPEQTLYRILEEPLPLLRLPDGRETPALYRVLDKTCCKEPAGRYGNAADLAAALTAALTGIGQPATFREAIARPSLAPARPPSRPMIEVVTSAPYQLSEGPPLGVGVKCAVVRFVVDWIGAEAGPEALPGRLGMGWMRRLSERVLTDWIDGTELQRLFACAAEWLGGAAAQRRLGRAFADAALSATYRSLLQPGEPEQVVRRTQVMLRLWLQKGESCSEELGPGRWRLRISGLPTLNPGIAEGIAGFIERYLELAGGTDAEVAVAEAEGDAAGGAVFDFAVSFTPPSGSAAQTCP